MEYSIYGFFFVVGGLVALLLFKFIIQNIDKIIVLSSTVIGHILKIFIGLIVALILNYLFGTLNSTGAWILSLVVLLLILYLISQTSVVKNLRKKKLHSEELP